MTRDELLRQQRSPAKRTNPFFNLNGLEMDGSILSPIGLAGGISIEQRTTRKSRCAPRTPSSEHRSGSFECRRTPSYLKIKSSVRTVSAATGDSRLLRLAAASFRRSQLLTPRSPA